MSVDSITCEFVVYMHMVIRRVRASLMMCEKRTECDVEEKNTKSENGTSVSRHARLVPAKTNRNALAQLLLGEITLLH